MAGRLVVGGVLALGVQYAAALSRRTSGFDASSPFNERLQSLSLLGSHFGLVDIPATFVSWERS